MFLNRFKNKNFQEGRAIKRELFYFLSFLLFLSFALEIIFPNIIIAYLNLNILVVIWLIIALIALNDK